MQTMLYRAPGPHDIHGHKLDYVIVADEDVPAHLQAGWFLTTTQAVEALTQPAAPAEAEDKPPTRDELEQKAKELGIEFGPRISDKKLRERIEERLAAA